jgi:hypothetical protein
MPIKRNSPAKRPAAPKRSRTVRAAVAPIDKPVGLIMSSEEKRQLILAHAAMRAPRRDPLQMLSVWAGVMVTLVVVFVGWWWAATPSYVDALKDPDPSFQPMYDELKILTERMKTLPAQTKDLDLLKDSDELGAGAQDAKQQAINVLSGTLNATTTSVGGRTDLFKPPVNTTTTSSTL